MGRWPTEARLAGDFSTFFCFWIFSFVWRFWVKFETLAAAETNNTALFSQKEDMFDGPQTFKRVYCLTLGLISGFF